MKKFAAFDYSITILTGSKPQRLKKIDQAMKSKGLQILVTNYESTWRDGMAEALDDFGADLILCDESQRIKSHDSKQSKRLHQMGDAVKYKLILSGTPVQNHVVDIYSQYRFLNPDVFGRNFYAFRNNYCVLGGWQNKVIVAEKNIEDLTKKMYGCAYRVTKAEALDLPEQVFVNIMLDFEPKEREVYNWLNRQSVVELETGECTATTILTKLLRMQQFTGGYLQADDSDRVEKVSDVKMKALSDILDDHVIDADKKLVIFAKFRNEIDNIKKLVASKGICFSAIYGDIKLEDRGEIIKDFQENPTTKVIICQIQCAGLGITLTAADTCVYYSLDYNYANYAQSIGRIHRIGQTNKCTYLQLVIKNTIDEKILKALENKGNLAKNVVDNWRTVFNIEE